MPVPWVALPLAASVAQSVVQVEPDLVVVAESVHYDRVADVYTFRQGVVARYGPTTLTADELVFDRKAQTGRAQGNVSIVDPDGTAQARNLEFVYNEDPKLRTGKAEDLSAEVGGVIVRAKRADLKFDLWVLEDVYGTACGSKNPLFALRSPRMTLIPGKRGHAVQPRLDLFGSEVLRVPTQSFNLDRRAEGFRLPTPSFRKGDGFGMNWASGWMLSDSVSLSGGLATYPNSRPTIGVELTHTSIRSDRATTVIAPTSDLEERFAFSYWESVGQPRPSGEAAYLRAPRDSVSLGSHWHEGNANQAGGDRYSKPIELSYERGGDFGGVGALATARVQSIRKDLEPTKTRLQFSGSAGPRPVKLAPGVLGHARVDAAAFLGDNRFAWAYGTLGLTYQPIRPLTLSAALRGSVVSGTPEFDFDRLVSPNGSTFRVDLDGGATQFSYLLRHDTRAGWFDRQYLLSHSLGCIEPYVLYRSHASDYRFGVRLRLGNLLEILSRRDVERGAMGRTVIDGPGRQR